jgi:chromate transport protein ChrA
MVNLVLGILIGIAGSWLYARPQSVPWYAWVLFMLGAAAIVFAFDVLIGSYKEHQPRAAWMGLSMFGSLGVVMILVGWGLFN